MSLRFKLVAAMVALAAMSTLFIGVFAYRSTASQLRTQVDRSLVDATDQIRERPGGPPTPRDPDPRQELRRFRAPSDVIVQYLSEAGRVIAIPEAAGSGIELPVTDEDLRIALGDGPRLAMSDVRIDGERFAVLTTGAPNGRGAIQTARSLAEIDQVTDELRRRVLAAGAVAVLIAAGLGWVVADQFTRRLVRLTEAAERVATTRDLSVDVPVDGDDETGRLGTAFSQMLTALASSKDVQQRLVQDAGHELRTPLTSLRTNVFALRRSAELTPDQRNRLLQDLESETEQLSRLVDEVVEVATDRRDEESLATIALGELVQRVADRWSQRSGRAITVQVDDVAVTGRALALERAVGNLIENALKFDSSENGISVSCQERSVAVADRGPGIGPDDVAHVFDRFYRATAARSMPGSGLGLSIVAAIVESHGGTVFAQQRDGGGAVVGFTLPADPRTPTSP